MTVAACWACSNDDAAGETALAVFPCCGFPIARVSRAGISLGEKTDDKPGPRPSLETHAGTTTLLIGERPVWIGRGSSGSDSAEAEPNQKESLDGEAIDHAGEDLVIVRHREIEPRHALFLRDTSSIGEREDSSDCVRFWVIAGDAELGRVFVDGRPVRASCLRDGQVVQLGPLAWQFHESKRLLVPVQPIMGFDLQVRAEVTGRLCSTELNFASGQMTAVIGPSGCGKSTLLETIRDGSGLNDELDATGLVYFVPQQDLVHEDLRLGDALAATARVYGREILPYQLDEALDSVGLPLSSKSKLPRELSGGQLRRFRLAGALLSGAGVIVLDEPDSGLDHETANEIVTLLRALAIRGATVIAVTHHQHVLELFDRVVKLRATTDGGAVADDGLVRATIGDASTEANEWKSDRKGGRTDERRPTELRRPSALSRLTTLLWREFKKLTSPRIAGFAVGPLRVPSCVVPWVFIPLLFAAAVAISVPSDPELNLADGLYGDMSPRIRVGFLSLICVIWMSASGSHLSLTRERKLLEYERSHGISWWSVLVVKSTVLCGSGVLQTGVFFAMLTGIRHQWLQRSFLILPEWLSWFEVAACFVSVSIAATMLGILISTLARGAPLLAAASLPVVLMVQILFSAPFAVPNPDGYAPLADYERLTIRQLNEQEDEAGDEDDWEDSWEMIDSGEAKPMWVTSLISYFTISRYGDQWLRSFAVSMDEVESKRLTQWFCAGMLALMSAFCLAVSWVVLQIQTTRLSRRFLRKPKSMPKGGGWKIASGVGSAMILLSLQVLFFASNVPAQERDSPARSKQSSEASDGAGQGGWTQKNRKPEVRVVKIPLVDGKYDENSVRKAFGIPAGTERLWRELDQQDRVGLVALELLGKLKFEINERELRLEIQDGSLWGTLKSLAPPRLLGVEQAKGASDVVVFVHGLEGSAATFQKSDAKLESMGIATMRFDFPNDGPPEEVGEMLREQLESFHWDSPNSRCHLVAHSLGGLVATWAVTEPGFDAECVANVFTLGTPFEGSSLAEFHTELELLDVFLRTAARDFSAFDTLSDGRGEAAEALKPGSVFLKSLQRRTAPKSVQFHLGAGTKSFLPSDRRLRLAEILPDELSRMDIGDVFADRLIKLIGSEELRSDRGDGAVTVKSALGWPIRSSTRRFALTHTELVSDAEPLKWVLETVGLGEAEKVNPK
ncbi:MAG: AAA family ATPase [Planctomycetota bacterium]